jgi:hypothetical protein
MISKVLFLLKYPGLKQITCQELPRRMFFGIWACLREVLALNVFILHPE